MHAQGAKQLDQIRQLIVRVEAAGIGKHPDLCALEEVRLRADRRSLQPEAVAVGPDAQECDDLRPVLAHFGGEAPAARDEFRGAHLLGCGGRAVHEIGDAVAVVQQRALLGGRQLPRREPRSVERRPEAVSRTSEVVSRPGGIQPGIDAHEEHPKARPDDVGDALVLAGEKIGLAGPRGRAATLA